MYKIICISDIHGKLPEDIPSGNLLIVAGDICPDFPHYLQQKDWFKDVFTPWTNKLDVNQILVVAGNHDLVCENKNVFSEVLEDKNRRWKYLENSIIEVDGYLVYGSPYILPIWGAFQLKEQYLTEKYAKIPDYVDIVVSHGPPKGLRDEIGYWTHTKDSDDLIVVKENVGSEALRDRLMQLNALITVVGHIHPAYGYTHFYNTLIANAALTDEQYKLVKKPLEIILEDKKIVSYK